MKGGWDYIRVGRLLNAFLRSCTLRCFNKAVWKNLQELPAVEAVSVEARVKQEYKVKGNLLKIILTSMVGKALKVV